MFRQKATCYIKSLIVIFNLENKCYYSTCPSLSLHDFLSHTLTPWLCDGFYIKTPTFAIIDIEESTTSTHQLLLTLLLYLLCNLWFKKGNKKIQKQSIQSKSVIFNPTHQIKSFSKVTHSFILLSLNLFHSCGILLLVKDMGYIMYHISYISIVSLLLFVYAYKVLDEMRQWRIFLRLRISNHW